MMTDKVKLRQYQREYAQRNRYKHRERDRLRTLEKRAFVDSLKEECAVCGFSDKRALDFHHKDQELKKFKISDRVKAGTPIRILLEEIKKCSVLCANCHRILHYTVAEAEVLEANGCGPFLSG